MTNNNYVTSLTLNSVEFTDLMPQNYSFSIHDSIWNFFSTATLEIPDMTGQLREMGLSLEGNVFTLKFGTDDDTTLISDYVVDTDQVDTSQKSTTGLVSGTIKIPMIHAYYDKQEVVNKAYSGQISSIVKTVISDYNFDSKVFDETSCNSIWYRLAMTQSEFINKVLVPNSYSSNTSDTSFFAFITTDNNFNYLNYKYMFNRSTSASLTYYPCQASELTANSILSIQPFRASSKHMKFLRNRTVFTRSEDTGEYTSETHYIDDSPQVKSSSLVLPVVGNSSLVTDYQYYDFIPDSQGEAQALTARILFAERRAISLDKYMITLFFNPSLHAGDRVNIKMAISGDSNLPEYASFETGDYIIEDCTHTWDGLGSANGFTYLIVSRKFGSMPSTYTEKSLLFSGD